MKPDLISATAAQCPAHTEHTAGALQRDELTAQNSEEQPQTREGAVSPAYDNCLQEQKGSWG